MTKENVSQIGKNKFNGSYFIKEFVGDQLIMKCMINKNIIMSSFKSSRDIQKKEGGSDSCFG